MIYVGDKIIVIVWCIQKKDDNDPKIEFLIWNLDNWEWVDGRLCKPFDY
jgi:hypothetical protein